MSSYTKISVDDAKNIFSLYALEYQGHEITIEELIPLSLGISNSNYKVRSSHNTLLLKISNDKNEKDLAKEMTILGKLSELKFPYSLIPYKTKMEKNVFRYNDLHGVLFPFVEGIPPGPNDATCFEIGAALGLLHKKSANTSLRDIREHEEVGFGPVKIFNYTKSSLCPADFYEAQKKYLPNLEEHFILNNFEKGIIHGDLYYDNTLFDNNRLKVLLDFEQAGVGEFIFDIGVSISGTCLEKGFLNPMLIHSFLRGYQTSRPLPKIEKKLMSEAIVLGYFSISLWRIKRFKEGALNPALKDSYKDLLLKAQYFNQVIAKELHF